MKLILPALAVAFFAVGCTNDKNPKPDSMREKGPVTMPTTKPMATTMRVDAGGEAFGLPMKLNDSESISVAQLREKSTELDGKYVRVSGTVDKVCPKKGCWLQMANDKGEPLFVKFTCPIEGRLIPMEATGKPAMVEGVVKVKEYSQAEARHIAEEKGATAEEIEKIVGPQKALTLASPGAKVMD